jgi:hypothetical protein
MRADTGGDQFEGLRSFTGGESQDPRFVRKTRYPSFKYGYGRHVDVRASARGFSVLPGMAKTSGGVVTDLIQDMTQVPNGDRYSLGDSGNVYKTTSGGIWSKIGNIGENGGAGILYRSDSDCIYITGQTKVSRISKVSTAPALDVNWFQYGVSSAPTCYKTGGASSYTLPAALTESTTHMRTFIADIEPLVRIGVKPVVAAGNWTMTIHDDANNSLGSLTVPAANLLPNQTTYFTFSPIRLLVSSNNFTSSSSNGRTYHFHLTSTVATDTLQTTTVGTLADCDMELWANALVTTNNGLHPIYNFAQLTMFANEKYVAAYEPLQDLPTTSDFQRHRLTLPSGYETNGFAQLDLYVAITAERRSSNATQDFQDGKMLLWDGIQTTYNRYYDIPEGSPESLFSHKNVLYMLAGGALYESSGGQPAKIRTIKNSQNTFSGTAESTHCYPHMMTVRAGMLLVAYPGFTTNINLEYAVYGFGQQSQDFPMSWTTSYSLSTGSRFVSGTNNLRIGMVKNFGDTLYMSWRDDSTGTVTYGVDMVNNSSPPASDFELDLIYFDGNEPYREKLAKKALSTWDTLPAANAVSVTMKYKINNEASWHYVTDDGTAAVVSGTVAQQRIAKQFNGIEIGIDGTVTGNISPACTGLFLVYDPQPTRSEVSI